VQQHDDIKSPVDSQLVGGLLVASVAKVLGVAHNVSRQIQAALSPSLCRVKGVIQAGVIEDDELGQLRDELARDTIGADSWLNATSTHASRGPWSYCAGNVCP